MNIGYCTTNSNMAHQIKCFVIAFISLKLCWVVWTDIKHKCVWYLGLSLYFPDDPGLTEQRHAKPGKQEQETAQSEEPPIQTPEGAGV